MAVALNLALRDSMLRDQRVLLLGEDIGHLGGVFRVTRGLLSQFGPSRVIDFPIAESALVGTGIGLALGGMLPVLEIQFDGFLYPALDQLISHLARFHYRTSGEVSLPVVIRIPFGGGVGALEHHSDNPETYLAHTSGIRVIVPSSPRSAYALLCRSIESNDPVVFLEPKRLYQSRLEWPTPENTDIARAVVRRSGLDLTIATYGALLADVMHTAQQLATEGIDVEVVDLRSLSPLDIETLLESVQKTKHLVVAHEARRFLGVGAEISAVISEQAFSDLAGPVLRVAGSDPPGAPPAWERQYMPSSESLRAAVYQALKF